MDRTLKLRAYSDDSNSKTAQGKSAKEEKIALELEKKTALLEEERNKSVDLLKTIVQLREKLKQEEAKTAELEAKLGKETEETENQLATRTAQLEEERKLSLEYMRTIEQLREKGKQDLEKSAQMLNRIAELEAKVNKMDSVEENQLVKKNTLLEEEKKKSVEYAKLVDQLREKLRQNQGIPDDLVEYIVELEKKRGPIDAVLFPFNTVAIQLPVVQFVKILLVKN